LRELLCVRSGRALADPRMRSTSEHKSRSRRGNRCPASTVAFRCRSAWAWRLVRAERRGEATAVAAAH
jgi:hypothetical protein